MGEFNVDEEYKPTPLISLGAYHGAIVDVKFDNETKVISFHVTLNENGGVMSDGETPIDGSTHVARVMIPRPGDENEYTKSGKETKRQWKINNMKRFAENLKINMSTPTIIAKSIINKEWVGLAVDAKIKIGEWEGNYRNEIERLVARQS
jgi:hypothetical protein